MGGRGASSILKKSTGKLKTPFYQVGVNRFFVGDIFVSKFNEGGDERDWNSYLVTKVSENGIETELQDTGSLYRKNQIGTFTNMDNSSRALQRAEITEQGQISRQAYAKARMDEKRKLIKVLKNNNIKYNPASNIDHLKSIVSQNKKAGLIK